MEDDGEDDCEHSDDQPPPNAAGTLNQPLAGARNRLDAETACAFCKLPKRRDRAVDDVVADEAAIPAQIDEFVAGDDLTASARERDQHLQVLRLKPFDGAVESGVARCRIDRRAADAERMLRAQIDRAAAMGIHPTHVDSHMGALFTTPGLMATYIKVAHDYHLPFLTMRTNPFGGPPPPNAATDIPLDAVIIADENVPRDKWKDFYLNAIAGLKPGLTEIIVHLGHDDAELQAVMVNHEPYGSAWRQRDYEVVNSPETCRSWGRPRARLKRGGG